VDGVGKVEFGEFPPKVLSVSAVKEQRVAGPFVAAGESAELGDERLILVRGNPDLGDLPTDLLLDEPGRHALFQDLSLIHDHNAVAELLGLFHILGREDQGGALPLELPEPLPDQVPGLGVEAGRRLVGDDDPGLIKQGPGDEEPPFHARGQLVDLAVSLGLELDELEEALDPLPGDALRNVEEPGKDHQVLADREVDVQSDLLGNDPGFLFENPVIDMGGQAVDRKSPRGHGGHAVDHFYGRGLAGAVRPQETEAFALLDLEGDAIDGRKIAVFLEEVLRHNDRVHFWTFVL